MKYLFFILLSLLANNALKAQTTQDSVMAVINTLFNGMKESDSAMVQSAFADSAVLQTIVKNKTGKVAVKIESVKGFASFVGKQEKNIMDERIGFNTILVDADLASAWTPYKFYYKGEYSHCGVNSFQLVRINNVWKIQYLIDTRRKTCK